MIRRFIVEVNDSSNSSNYNAKIDGEMVRKCVSESGHWLSEGSNVTVDEIPVDPDELKVKDEVKTDTGYQARITEVRAAPSYRLRFLSEHGEDEVDSNKSWPRDRLTKLPPAPKYHWKYSDDRIGVYGNDGFICTIHMRQAPEKVKKWIVRLAGECGLDADEARKMIAKPTVIETITAGDVVFEALRTEVGWHGRVTINTPRGFTRRQMRDTEAKRLFPGVKGPCYAKVL